jgi:hypothetical protein
MYNEYISRSGLRGLLHRIHTSVETKFGLPRRIPNTWETASFSKKDNQLYRRGVKHSGLRWWVEQLGEKWGHSLSRYEYLIGGSRGAALLRSVGPLLRRESEEVTIEVAKEISRLSTEYAVLCGKSEADYLLDLHVLAGYDTVLNRVDVMKDIEKEIARDCDPLPKGYEHRMQEKIRKIVLDNFRFKSDTPGFRRYVSFRDAWSTPGATTLPGRLELATADGDSLRVKGKLASSLLYSDDELVQRCLEMRGAVVKPFRKEDERVKTRVVYGYDFESFLRCGYISELMETAEAGGRWCPLGYSKSQKYGMREELLGYLGKGRLAVSLDQSAFDTRQRASWIATVLRLLFGQAGAALRAAGHHGPAAEVEELGRVEEFSFLHAKAGNIPWKVGVPSGHRWTALIDSILNRAAAEIVCEDLGFTVLKAYYQGDDAVLIGTASRSIDFASGYEKLDLKVNSLKTWVDSRGFDFLHELYDGRDVRAFPARVASSLIWKKPNMGGSAIASRSSRLQERLANCLKGVRRGLLNCGAVAFGTLAAYVKEWGEGVLDTAVLNECLCTPMYLGGFGFGLGGGRVSCILGGGRVHSKRYSLPRTVVNRFGGARAAGALVDRLSEGVFLRCERSTVAFVALKGHRGRDGGRRLGSGRPIQTAFHWRDPNPWTDQLVLEGAVSGHQELPRYLPLPDVRLRSLPLRRAVRALRCISKHRADFNCNLESRESTGEHLSFISDKLNRIWNYSLALVCLYGDVRQDVLFGDLGDMVRCLQRWTVSHIAAAGRGVLVRV